MSIAKEELGNLIPIADGALGKVYEVPEYQLPDDPIPLAYKEFIEQRDEQAASVDATLAFRAALTPDERAELDSFSVWPRAMVVGEDGITSGFLMPLLSPEFFCQLIDTNTGQLARKPREMGWLMAKPETRNAARVDVPDIDRGERLFLMARLTYAIGWLHRHRWVFGDLSFRNVAFALDPPQVKLLDCDGTAGLDNPSRKQYSTPFWDPPESRAAGPGGQRALQDDVTDVYKLGLATLRCLSPGQGASTDRRPSRIGSQLNAEGKELLTATLSGVRSDRPSAKKLYSYLRKTALPLVTVPVVRSARLAQPFRLRVQTVRIDWRLAHAAYVIVRVGQAFSTRIDDAENRAGCDIMPGESGQVSITAHNKYGSVRVELGELTLYELPSFNVDLSHLPRAQIQDIEAFTAEPLVTVLGGEPGTRLAFPDVPAIEAPDRLPPIARPRFEKTVLSASEVLTELIAEATSRFTARLGHAMKAAWNG